MSLFGSGLSPGWLKVVSVLLVLFLNTTALAVPDGDVDGDCRVTAADSLLILRAVVGLDPITPRMQIHGDVAPLGPVGIPSPDGIISLADALIVLEKSINLVAWDSPPLLITSQPQTTALSDVPFQYQVTLAPPRNVLTRFSLDQGSVGMSIDSTSGLLSWLPQSSQIGRNSVVVKVAETPCSTVRQSFVVQVSANPSGNQAPVANAGPQQTITLAPGQSTVSVTLNGSASSDPDGTVASYAWSGLSGAPQPTPATGATPTVTLGTGSYSFSLVVTDNNGASSAPSQVTVTVNPAGNQAPIARAGANQTVTLASGQATTSVTLNGSASSDPDGSIASYAWSGVGGAPQPTPASGALPIVTLGTGVYSFALVVTDNLGATSAPAQVSVTVNPTGNQAPTANAGTNQTVTLASGQATTSVTLNGTASSDPDGTVASYAWSGLSGAPQPNPTSGATPSVTLGTGTYLFQLVVTDNSGAASAPAQVAVTVNPGANQAPTANAGANQTITLTSGQTTVGVTLNGNASRDPDGSIASYAWNGVSGAPQPTPAAAATPSVTLGAGTYLFSLVVTDNAGATSAPAQVTVTVNPVGNQAPTANAGPNQTITLASGQSTASVTLNGGASSDPDGSIASYAWSGVNGAPQPAPAGGAAPSVTLGTGVYTFALVVTDNSGAASTPSQVTVTVNPAGNLAPTANAGTNQTVTLAAGQATASVTLNGSASSDPDGSIASYAWSGLNGAPQPAPATGALPGVTLPAGSYGFSLVVTDNKGAASSASLVTVTVNPAPVLSLRILTASLPAPKIDAPYSVTLAVSNPAGSPLTFSLGSGIPAGAGIDPATGTITWRPTVAEIGKSYQFDAAVSDGKGGSDSRRFLLTVSDTVPPVVVLNAPASVIPGASFKVTASPTDNLGVARVRISVNGQMKEYTAPPFQYQVDIGQVAAIGSTLPVTATAWDAAGNSGSASATITVVGTPANSPPLISLAAPARVTARARVVLTASAASTQGVARLDFKADGVTIASAVPPETSATYTVPADLPPGATIDFTATAVDFSGNSASAQAQSTVAELPDTVPPTIALDLPATVTLGTQLPVNLTVSDDAGVAGVTIFLAHQQAGSFQGALSQIVELPLPPGVDAGMDLVVEVRATDTSGNQAGVTKTVQVLAAEVRQGLLAGLVFDDTTGLPLAGAQAVLSRNGADPVVATSDDKGRYTLVADEGEGSVAVAKSGYTRCDLPAVAVVLNAGERLPDLRLTPLATVTTPVASVQGGTLSLTLSAAGAGLASALGEAGVAASAGDFKIAFPPGALAADQELSATQVGAQGLQGRLPAGWSPVAAASLQPSGLLLATPAQVTAPNLLGRALPVTVLAAYWDQAGGAWTSLGSAAVAADRSTLTAQLPVTGQVAFLVPDAAAVLPAALPASGEPLAALAQPALPASLQSLVKPDPKVILYKPGVKSAVGTRVAGSTPLASGSVVWANIAEEYSLYSGERLVPEPYRQEVVLYSFGLPDGVLLADYPVSPDPSLAKKVLEQGLITVTAAVPPDDSGQVSVVGPAGGALSLTSGESLSVPAGAVARLVPALLKPFDLGASGLSIPPGFLLVGGVVFSVTGSGLAKPATLSLPKPAGFSAGGDLLLVRAVKLDGVNHFAVIGSAAVGGTRIVSSRAVPGTTQVLFPGVVDEGTILVLQATQQIGYAGGTVIGTDAAPFSGAVVSSDALPLIALSSTGGGYAAALASGPFTLAALDRVKLNRGSAAGSVASGQFSPVDLTLKIDLPAVVSVTPAAGAADVALADPIRIRFSKPLDPATVTAAAVTLTSAAGPVNGILSQSSDGLQVTLRPAQPLEPKTLYTLSASVGIRDIAGYPLAAPFSSSFTSLDTSPPTAPPAGSVTSSIPGAANTTTVTATQGTAGPHDTVYVVNLASGARNQVQVSPSGAISATVPAVMKDRLQLEITNPAGLTTTVALPRFQQANPDGSLSAVAGPEGGTITGPGGIAVDVPAGAFADSTVLTIKPLDEASFPVQLSAQDKTNFGYSGGIKLDIAGKDPARYLNISIPKGVGDGAGDQWVVVQAVDMNGAVGMASIDTAHIINDRITTSSPPCPGVTGKGSYAVIKSFQPMGVVYGNLGPALAGYSSDVSSNSVLFPYGINIFGTFGFCIPVFSSDLTLEYNTVNVLVDAGSLTPPIQEVTVKNNTSQTGSRFPGDKVYYPFPISGVSTDQFKAIFVNAATSTEQELPILEVATAGAGMVEVRVAIGSVTFTNSADSVRVENSTATPVAPVTSAVSSIKARLTVDGGTSDSFAVTIVNPVAGSLPVLSGVSASANGPENLLFKIKPGALQTVRPNGAHLQDMKLVNGSSGITSAIPLSLITADNGLTFNFAGNLTDSIEFVISFDDGSTASQLVSKYTIRLKDPQGVVVKTVSLPSPFKDMKVPFGPLFDSPGAPTLIPPAPELLNRFNPASDQLTLGFSEALDPATVTGLTGTFVVRDSSGALVPGELRLWGDAGNQVTFIPSAPFKLNSAYTVTISGVKDLGGAVLNQPPFTIKTVGPALAATIPLRSAIPIRSGANQYDVPLNDLALISKTDGTGKPVTTVVAVTDTKADQATFRIATFDIPADPTSAVRVGTAQGGGGKQRVHVIQGADLAISDKVDGCLANITGGAGSYRFKGDLAITSSTAVGVETFLSFFDVTDPANPCQLGGKLLTGDPDNLSGFNSPGTVHASANAFGVTAVQGSDGYTALAGVQGVGIMSVNIGQNIPEPVPGKRVLEGVFSGNYLEVISDGGTVITLNPDIPQLENYDLNFALIGSLALDPQTTRLVYAGPLQFDPQRNGTLKTYDLIFAHGLNSKTVQIIDMYDPGNPQLLGKISFDDGIVALAFDRNRKLLSAASRGKLYVVDLSTLSAVDLNGDGIDDRIVWTASYPATSTIKCLRSDEARGLVYVGTSGGLDVYRLDGKNLYGIAKYIRYNVKAPLGLDFDNPVPLPIRGAIVELQNSAGVAIDKTNTNDSGFYTFMAPLNQDLKVVVKAATGDPAKANPHLSVKDPATGVIYSKVQTPVHCASATGCQADILADQKWVWLQPPVPQVPPCADAACQTLHYGIGSYTVREASPFAILDTTYGVEDMMRRQTGTPAIPFPDLKYNWSPAVANSTAYTPGGAWTITVNGTLADTDEYDPVIMLHEWMHYYQDAFIRSDTPGGNHSSGEKSDHRLSFNEGFATGYSLILNQTPVYTDTLANGRFSPGQLLRNYETGVTDKGFYNENAIVEMFYALNKAKPAPLDVSVPFKDMHAALLAQEKTLPYISIYSFIHELYDPIAADATKAATAAKLVALFRTKNIDIPNSDKYEPNDPLLYNPISVSRAGVNTYNKFTASVGNASVASVNYVGRKFVAGTDLLTTSSVNDPGQDGNKLLGKLFFKFTVSPAQAGHYQFTVTTTTPSPAPLLQANWDASFKVLKNDKPKNTKVIVNASAPGVWPVVSPVVQLDPGDYVMDVSTWVCTVPGLTSCQTSLSAPCGITLAVTPK